MMTLAYKNTIVIETDDALVADDAVARNHSLSELRTDNEIPNGNAMWRLGVLVDVKGIEFGERTISPTNRHLLHVLLLCHLSSPHSVVGIIAAVSPL